MKKHSIIALCLIACAESQRDEGPAPDAFQRPDSTVQVDASIPDAAPKPARLLAVGDSLQAGYFLPSLGGLRITLASKGLDMVTVGRVEAGPEEIGNWRNCECYPGQGFAYLSERVLEVDPASWDLPIVVAGTAQSIMEQRGELQPSDPRLLADRLGPGLQVWAIPPPMHGAYALAPEDTLDGYRQQIRAMALERDNIMLVDLFTGYPYHATSDGVHPNAEGYEWMGEQFYAALSSL